MVVICFLQHGVVSSCQVSHLWHGNKSNEKSTKCATKCAEDSIDKQFPGYLKKFKARIWMQGTQGMCLTKTSYPATCQSEFSCVYIWNQECGKSDYVQKTIPWKLVRYVFRRVFYCRHKRSRSSLSLKSVIKEARAGCRLKNRLREFFLIFAYVIFMVFRIYLCAKNHTSPWL